MPAKTHISCLSPSFGDNLYMVIIPRLKSMETIKKI